MPAIPYFDAHCDTPVELMLRGGSLRKNGCHLDLDRLSAYAPAAQVFAVCTEWKAELRDSAEAVLDAFLAQLAENADKIALCRNAGEIAAANAAGRIAALLSYEGASQLGCSVEALRRLHAKGLRIVHLTWNFDNALCGCCKSSDGLTEQGRAFVTAAQDMGVAVDLSHLSERGFWDVLEAAEKPVLAGHSNARALCDHPRNLTDAQFSALARRGGVAGLNLCPGFLGRSRDVEAVVDHAEHFLALGGEKAVCLGTDFDGTEPPEGISGVQDMEKVYEAMLRRGWREETVRDVFRNNLMEFFGRAL